MQPSFPRVVWAAIVTASVAPMTCAQHVGYTVLAHYSFDDGTANDDSGNNHHGVIIGDVSSRPGIIGTAMRFDETGGHIRVPDRGDLQTGRVSLSLWIKIGEPPVQDAVLLAKRDGSTGYELKLLAESSAIAFRVMDGPDEAEIVTPFPVIPGAWTAIAARYDGVTLKLHLHGSYTGATTAPGIEFSTNADLTIGRGLPTEIFTGLIDEVYLAEGVIPDATACVNALKLWDEISATCISRVIDVTSELGLGDEEHHHFAIAHSDVNNDGWVDMYYANGKANPTVPNTPSGICPDVDGEPIFPPQNINTFYLNQGDGTFSADIAEAVGIDDFWNAMRHVWVDYDNDGLRDLHSHNFLVSPLYRQVSVDPLLFEDVTEESGLKICLTSGTGQSWADLDNNGYVDVIAGEYSPARPPEEHVNQLWMNNGDGTFTEVTGAAGDLTLPSNPMGLAMADFDNDGDQDVYFSNSHTAPSRLLRHDGLNADGVPQFTDVAEESGVAITGPPGRGFGAAWGDYNADGRLDLLFIRESDSRLYRSDGFGDGDVWQFTDVTGVGGLDLPGLTFHDGAFADIDNDGWLDIILTNNDNPGPNRVYLNNGGDGTWREVAKLMGLDLPDFKQRGVIPFDYDNDGDLDLSLMTREEGDPNFLYLNDTRGNNWVQFRLTGTVSNRDAIGARINVTAQLEPGGAMVSQIREVIGGTGFFSDVPKIQTFGLAKAHLIQVRIRWPNGLVQEAGPLDVNQRFDFVEPSNIAGDFDGDGAVGSDDLLFLLGDWGPCDECGACIADLDGDCVVGTPDLLILLGNWT